MVRAADRDGGTGPTAGSAPGTGDRGGGAAPDTGSRSHAGHEDGGGPDGGRPGPDAAVIEQLDLLERLELLEHLELFETHTAR